MSEYDPLLPDEETDDLLVVEERFAAAAAPYLSAPLTWLAWAVLLPGAALSTSPALELGGPAAAALLWSATILVGGVVELAGIRRARRGGRSTPLASWVMRAQASLSALGLVLSVALISVGMGRLLPGLWLLLLGYSFYTLGGLAFPPFRAAGLWYQVGGAVALLPLGVDPFQVLAVVTATANLWLFWRLRRRQSS